MEHDLVRPSHHRGPWAIVGILWLALLGGAYYSAPISNPPGLRGDLWGYVPDLFDPPPRAADAGHAGWQYFPQRLDLLCVAGSILAGAWSFGHLLLRLLRLPIALQSPEKSVFAVGCGLATLSLVTLGAGLVGCLSRVLLGSLIAAGLCLEIGLRVALSRLNQSASPAPLATATLRTTHTRPIRTAIWCMLPLVPFVLAMVLGSLLPSTDFDVNEYHFEGPKEYFQAGRITFLEHNVYTSFPFATEMLTLLGMVLRDDWYRGALAGKCVLMTFGPLTAWALYSAGMRCSGPVAGWGAAFLYLATPWTYRISTIAYAEGGVSFYLCATLLAGILAWRASAENARDGAHARLWLLTGLLAGAAFSCKYPALISVTLPMGCFACVAARCYRQQMTRSWQIPLLFALGVLLVIGPWLLKNLVETGNPVYPLAYRIFGGRDWDPVLNAKWTAGHSPPNYSFASLWALACEMAYKSDWISPLLFGLFPFAIFPGHGQPRRPLRIGLLNYVGWLFLSCWLFTHRIDRFWVPMLPVVTLLAGQGLNWWWTAFPGKWARSALLVLLFAQGAFQLELMTGVGNWCGYNDYLRDLTEAGEVASSITAPELVYLNRQLPPDAKVLSVGDAEMFYARFPVIYNTVFDRSIFEAWFCAADRLSDGDSRLEEVTEIRRTLESAGITHIYINWLEILRYRSPGNYGYTEFVRPEIMSELQELGVLGPAWNIPEAQMNLQRLDPNWVPELRNWGSPLIVQHGPDDWFLTFQVFPVLRAP
ncbi:MAG: hypothetical protein JSS02_19600 [Planctomycetes bacterium]|nr:hypothetical protein [Planctomycetota bacterium]